MAMFFLVLAIITNDGEIKMNSIPVDKCPDVAAFTETMNNLVTKKEMRGWNALCIPNGVGA